MIDFPFKAGQHLIDQRRHRQNLHADADHTPAAYRAGFSHGRAHDIEILVVTFTQAATQELNHRLSELLRDAALALSNQSVIQ